MSTPTYHLYVDDSGTRFIDRPSTPRRDGMDHFAFGGILIRAEDVENTKNQFVKLREAHGITAPFHSSSMRSCKKEWAWLGKDKVRAERLICDLTDFLCSTSGHATACVVHRPGYEAKYAHYGENRWHICKSAYTILIERAAKFSLLGKRKLAVYVEKTGPKEDKALRDYHRFLIDSGMYFDGKNSEKYSPLESADFEQTLLKNVNFFDKSSLLGQIADLMLYPLIKGRYDPTYRSFVDLMTAGRIIDCVLPPELKEYLGTKYFRFDNL